MLKEKVRNAVYLAKLGLDVTSYDQSPVGLKKTNKLADENNVTVKTIKIDLTTEKVNQNQYDVAVMVFGHVQKESQQFLIENMMDSVKPGGYIIFEVYSEMQLDYKTGGPKLVDFLYHPTQVLDWIKNYKCIHFYYGEADRNEGARHTGLGHIIQTVIKKE